MSEHPDAIRNSCESHPESAAAVRTLQWITIVWMLIEISVAMAAGIRAHSVALTGFGLDSAIEFLSAVIVLWRFRLGPSVEKRATRIAAILLYLLAVYIFVSVGLALAAFTAEPQPSIAGIALLCVATSFMPLLGRAKRKLASQTRSSTLRADAAQTNVCAYMSWISLSGLLLNARWHLHWADSAAALLLLPLIIREAMDAQKGESCECS